MTAKTTPAKVAPAKDTAAAPAPAATPAPAPTTDAARTKSTVGKDGTARCDGCNETKPVTKFPTARTAEGTYERDTTECRKCRDGRRATRKAEREAAKATAA